MVNVYLYGHLADKYGSEFKFKAKTVQEVLTALSCNFPDLMQTISKAQAYSFLVGKDGDKTTLNEDQIKTSLLWDDLHIVPYVGGAEGITISMVIMAIVKAVISAAISMAISYLIQSMMGTPEVSNYDSFDSQGKKASFLFTGSVNRTEQGVPVPIIYGGPVLVGSVVVSSGIDIEDVVK